MKTIGLIGGMSWESTVTYYQILNQAVKERLGGLHSAQVLLYSVDFQEIEECQTKGEWEKSGEILTRAAQSLERAGADLILICTNTMHKVAPQIQAGIGIPILHIAEATAAALKESQVNRVALLGTKYTMEQDFYKERIRAAGIEVLIPGPADVEIVNRVIFDELCLGVVSDDSRREFVRVINRLAEEGAQGVILGCTEIGLLIQQKDVALPVFDTTKIHALQGAWAALAEEKS